MSDLIAYENYFRVAETPVVNIELIEKRYALERDLLDAVVIANEQKAIAAFEGLAAQYMPPRLPDTLRDHRNYCITVNTLLRKAAEYAGVHPIHIDNLSNEHVRLIEQIPDVEGCIRFCRQCALDYCQLVREYTLHKGSTLTQRVASYISTDLSADLSLKAIAQVMNVNASYLSSLFKKEMGVSLTSFVNNRRIERAKRLLSMTNLPIKTIAQQCGVPDIYYFGRLFKKITGTTPKAWREQG